jgi:hypothetical protein
MTPGSNKVSRETLQDDEPVLTPKPTGYTGADVSIHPPESKGDEPKSADSQPSAVGADGNCSNDLETRKSH